MKRFTERIGVAFEPEMADKIKALKERFGIKFGRSSANVSNTNSPSSSSVTHSDRNADKVDTNNAETHATVGFMA